jgi:hypothetical protein
MRRGVTNPGRSGWFDLAAIGASTACLIHCLLLPLLFVALPAATLLIKVPESFHVGALLIALPASAAAMLAGYRHHGAVHPLAMAAIGLGLIGAGALGGFRLMLETGLSVAGSVVLAAAHIRNWRLCKTAVAWG